MAAVVVNGIEGVRALPLGEELGRSELYEITQHAVNQFAEATADHQWIHVDPERAQDGPFGGTIAHGCERVRFPSPVPVGSKVRASAVLDAVTDVRGGVQLTITVTITVDGAAKPACVATILVRHLI